MSGNKNIWGKTIIDDLFMIFLALVSVCLLIFEVVSVQTIEQQKVLDYADLTIASIFLCEFIYNFTKAKDKRSFFKGHWWELLASIPVTSEATQALRGLRLLRLIRLIRLLRVIRVAARIKILIDASDKMAKHSYVINIVFAIMFVIMSGSLGFHYFEYGVNPNIHNYFDSVWWAIVTVTTIGYGDIYPITVMGRILAIILMFTGIGILSLLTGAIASYFIKSKN